MTRIRPYNPAVVEAAGQAHDTLYLLSAQERHPYYVAAAGRLRLPLYARRPRFKPEPKPDDPFANSLRRMMDTEKSVIRTAQQIIREQERTISAAQGRLLQLQDRLTARLDQRAREGAKEFA